MTTHSSTHRPQRPESWSADAGDGPIARLDIPADSHCERSFEISVSMTMQPQADAAQAWHELRIFADGELQWSRRIASHRASAFDGLDYRFRRRVAVGKALQLLATSECSGGRRLHLRIDAEEDREGTGAA